MNESYFDGGLATYIGTYLLAAIITICTFGICTPWGICLLYNWKIKHTVINDADFISMELPCNYLVTGSNGSYSPLSL